MRECATQREPGELTVKVILSVLFSRAKFLVQYWPESLLQPIHPPVRDGMNMLDVSVFAQVSPEAYSTKRFE